MGSSKQPQRQGENFYVLLENFNERQDELKDIMKTANKKINELAEMVDVMNQKLNQGSN